MNLTAAEKKMLSIGLIKIKFGDGRAQPAGFGRGIVISTDEGGAIEDFSDDLALDSDPLAVNDADVAVAVTARFDQIFLDDRLDLSRRDRMKVEDIPDLESHRFVEWIEVRLGFFRLVGHFLNFFQRQGFRRQGAKEAKDFNAKAPR